MIGVEPIDLDSIKSLLLSGLSFLSLILIFKESKALTFGCVFVHYLWLYSSFNKDDLNNKYYVGTMGLYLLLSLILLLFVFKNKKST
jgi:hypothetical protein